MKLLSFNIDIHGLLLSTTIADQEVLNLDLVLDTKLWQQIVASPYGTVFINVLSLWESHHLLFVWAPVEQRPDSIVDHGSVGVVFDHSHHLVRLIVLCVRLVKVIVKVALRCK